MKLQLAPDEDSDRFKRYKIHEKFIPSPLRELAKAANDYLRGEEDLAIKKAKLEELIRKYL